MDQIQVLSADGTTFPNSKLAQKFKSADISFLIPILLVLLAKIYLLRPQGIKF